MTQRGRWEALFADLEGELAGEEARELDAEVKDRTRREHARLTLADRLAANEGAEVAVTTNGAGVIRGALTESGKDWLIVDDTLIPRAAVLGIVGLGERARDPEMRPGAALGIGTVLRAMAEDGPVRCVFVDGRTVMGRVERVGTDHVDLDGTAVPFRAIAAIRPA